MNMDQNILLRGWNSINRSYFAVSRGVSGFWSTPTIITWEYDWWFENYFTTARYLAETEELPALKAKITSNARDVANKLFTGAWPDSFSILCGERIDSNHQLGLDDIVLIWNGMRNFETSPGWLWVQFSKRSRWCGHWVLLTYIDTYFYITLWYPLVNIQKTMENHHFQWVNPLFLWSIFNSKLLT